MTKNKTPKTLLRSMTLMVMFLLGVSTAFAQFTVKGTVTDAETGESIPGVNIVEKGTSNGTITDIDGNFSVNVSSANAILVMSFVGYTSQEVSVNGRSVINIGLQTDIQQLSEVVVVGYGEQEKEDVTGAISDVSEENFNRGVIVAPENLIAGKIAGVQVTPNTGEPGAQSSIRIRGGTSINASNEPLYVIDGVPIDNSAFNPGGFSKGRNPLNFLNPNDIETFTVLKDASAAAIYGSRAANGVIIITTKKGKAGEGLKVNYDGWVSWATVAENLPVLNGDEFRAAVDEFAPERSDLIPGANTDWQSQVQQTGFAQNHNVSLTGGTENTGLRLGIGYLKQDGVIRNSSTERVTINFGMNASMFDDKLDITTNIKGSSTNDQFQAGGALGQSFFIPAAPVFNEADQRFGGYWEWPLRFGNAVSTNPVGENEQQEEIGSGLRSLGNIALNWTTPLKGLNANLNLGYDVETGERKRYSPTTQRSQQGSTPGESRIENFLRTSNLLEFYLKYAYDFGDNNNFDITAGYSYQNFTGEFPSQVANGFPNDAFGFNNPSVAEIQTVSNSVIENRLISFYGRVNFSIKDKYLFTGNLRRDGSTRFGPENRWGWFPSASFGWRLIDESFMDGVRGGALDNLKLRVGYGVNGNQEIGDYLYAIFYNPSDNQATPQFGDDFPITLRPDPADESIAWETTRSWNVGLDYGFLEGRLYGTINWYDKKTSDLLFEVPVPALTNLKNRLITNVGELTNTGIEFELNAVVFDTPEFQWDLGFNFSYNKNELTKINNAPDSAFLGIEVGGIAGGVGNRIQILRVGEPVFSFFTYKHKKDENGNPVTDLNEDGTTKPDTDLYEDLNGDDQIDDQDRVPNKNPFPDWLFGLTSNMYWKNFELSFTLRASLGNYVYNNNASANGNYSRIIEDNTPGNMHRSVLQYGFSQPQLRSEIYVEDASFLRMDNITLRYNVPVNSFNLSVYGTIQNAFVITGYSGTDPELGNVANDENPNAAKNGIDDFVYPRSRAFMLGVSIGI